MQTQLFAEGSLDHASHLAKPGSERERKMTATSGQKCLESLEKFNRPTLWVRTFVGCLIGQGDWYSTKCRLTWKLRATRLHRFYFQLVPSTLRTEGTGFGLLPTPRAMEIIEHPSNQAKRLKDRIGNQLNNLSSGARFGLLPTPAASEPGQAPADATNHGNYFRRSDGTKINSSINLLAKAGLLPTPQCFDAESTMLKGKEYNGDNKHSEKLGQAILRTSGIAGQLNPQFVEEMMGYPIGWTELSPSATPSSPK